MNSSIQLKTPTRSNRNSIGGVVLVVLLLVCTGLLPRARAVSPAPDGGYPGGNTAEGANALFSCTSGVYNTANGLNALFSDTTGNRNTANGINALRLNTTGTSNTAIGANTLYRNITGFNTAIGDSALFNNTIGGFNVAAGHSALENNIAGSRNTASGETALFNNSTGGDNIALGWAAGFYLTTGDNNIDIGNVGAAGESDTIRIGDIQTRTFITGIHGQTASGGLAVYVNSNGRLGTTTSSARFKQDIHSMDKASETVLALRPVTFRYKPELDPEHIPQFGLVAEEVEKVNPALVVRDAAGKPYSVRYEAVNAMLLNEFLKEHRKMQKQETTIAELKEDLRTTVAQQEKEIKSLMASLKAQAAQIQKVSARLDVTAPASKVVVNNP